MSYKKMKILYLVNIPSPYSVDYFNELGKMCDLTVVFDQNGYAHRDKSWLTYKFKTFNGIILNNKVSSKKFLSFKIIKYLGKGKYDAIFVTNMACPNGILAILYMKLMKIQYILESEGGYAKDGRSIKEKLKKFLLKKASYYFSANKEGDKYFLAYGAKNEKLVWFPFTSNYEKDILLSPKSRVDKQLLKHKLGIKEDKIILSIGRFIPIKGFDVLIKAFGNIKGNVGFYIIGGQPTEEYLKIINENKISGVHFLEFMKKEDLTNYYQASDVFVLNSQGDVWGLVINEAMVNGLPIVSSNKCIAGVELIENFKNGFIVTANDIKSFTEKTQFILDDEETSSIMAKNNLEKIKAYTFENMANVHINFLANKADSKH